MKFHHHLLTPNPFLSLNSLITPPRNPIPLPRHSIPRLNHSSLNYSSKLSRFVPICSLSTPTTTTNNKQSSISTTQSPSESNSITVADGEEELNVEVGSPVVPSFFPSPTKLSVSGQAFLLLTFIASTTCVAFVSLVVAAIPTLHELGFENSASCFCCLIIRNGMEKWFTDSAADGFLAMGRAATSLSKLADTAREELPSTMTAIRLSGMEISDLTLELSDLSQEIADGVNKSTQAVQAAEAGIRQLGSLARHHTVSMIQERASLPEISLQPVVAGAAKKTSHAVGQATKRLLNIISRGESSSGNEGIDRVEV
ncbi:hypothetical protein Tsubulata_000805 [Turnera subulata]|uniref:Uncharacterized protein n=1 Tax=Turnera subulata TaxID=218843 RepID=A0A9Q0GA96_9ROSI|nr:hypothetical protein Tsubulata_000805 [Turnera subulata]